MTIGLVSVKHSTPWHYFASFMGEVNTLTQDKKTVWHQAEGLNASLSFSTFWCLAKKHLRHFKDADSVNDYCIYCHDLKKQVLPQEPCAQKNTQLVQLIVLKSLENLSLAAPFRYGTWLPLCVRSLRPLCRTILAIGMHMSRPLCLTSLGYICGS